MELEKTLNQLFSRNREAIDQPLVDLAWSLWGELGIANTRRRHQDFLILPEELLILTASLGKTDLRNAALEWCSKHHSLISISRLKTLLKTLPPSATTAFSSFANTLNSLCHAHWPVPEKTAFFDYRPGAPSLLPEFTTPALLSLRLRALFGVGARADLIAYFLSQPERDCSISDTVEIGYSKRNLADVLEGFAKSGIFQVFFVRNQQRYSFARRQEVETMVAPLPKYMPSWRHFLSVVLTLRESEPKSFQSVMQSLKPHFRHLNWTLPSSESDIGKWLTDGLQTIAYGKSSYTIYEK